MKSPALRTHHLSKGVTLLAVAAMAVTGLSMTGALPANAADAPLSQGKTATTSSSLGAGTADQAVDGDGGSTCPATNVALNQPATASSAQGADTGASAAVDGNAASRWSSASSDPQWLQVDLGSSQAICGVSITWEAAYGKAFEIQTSQNGKDWTDIYSTTTSIGGTQNLDVTGSGRFIRVYGTARGTQYGYSIYEFQVFSTGADGNDDPTLNAGCQPDGTYVAPAAPDFGDNVVILDPSMTNAQINAKLAAVSNEDEFSTNRHQVYFLPGTYGCGTDTDNTTATNIINANVGFYESVAGLGASPDDVTINGALHVEPVQSSADAPWFSQSPGSLDNFWRSMSNVKINPIQQPVGDDATRTNPEGVTDQNTMRWAVSQASPLRRVDITGNLTTFGRFGAYASGGYLADSKVAGTVQNGSQQQWYTRDSSLGSWNGAVWNQVFSGVIGAPSDATYPAPAYTNLPSTPESREAPFLYVDGDAYKVFVPNAKQGASGADWSTDAAHGASLPISSFFIVKPTDSAATINGQLAAGKNLIITPGVYDLSESLKVDRADTVILGQGEATLSPTNGNAAITIGDVAGVKVSGVTIDAGATTSDVLVQVGPKDASVSDPADPTTLSDVFVRVGGAHEGSVKSAIVVNSDNVLLDDIWSWRADHGTGVGWSDNTADHGLVVNGDHVTATGLFVEHYQKAQVVWNGNDGTTIFYQSELPYDPPTQADWMDGTRNGYASYQVANSVTSHHAYGLGVYSFFDPTREQGGVDQNVFAESAIEAPVNPNVTFHHVVTQFLSGGGGITHGVNSTGNTVSATSPTGPTAYIVDYPAAGTPATSITFASSPAAATDSGWYQGPLSLTVGVTGDTGATLTASVDGGGPTVLNGPITLGDGSHTVDVTATDAAGDVEAVASWSGTVDGTAPTASSSANPATAAVTITATDAGSGVASVQYAIDGGAWQAYSAPVVVTGSHAVTYRATDAAGNVSATGALSIAPTFAVDPTSVKTGGTLAVAGTFLPQGTYTVQLGSTKLGTVTVGANGVLADTVTVPLGAKTGSQTVQLLDSGKHVVASATLAVSRGSVLDLLMNLVQQLVDYLRKLLGF